MSPLPHHPMLLLGQGVLRPAVIMANLSVLDEVVLSGILVSVIDGLADVGGVLLEVNQGLWGDLERKLTLSVMSSSSCDTHLHMRQTSSLLVEEAVMHPLSQDVKDLLLDQPVPLKLGVGLLPVIRISHLYHIITYSWSLLTCRPRPQRSSPRCR